MHNRMRENIRPCMTLLVLLALVPQSHAGEDQPAQKNIDDRPLRIESVPIKRKQNPAHTTTFRIPQEQLDQLREQAIKSPRTIIPLQTKPTTRKRKEF